MTLLCKSYHAEALLDGRIKLEVESPVPSNAEDIDPNSNRVLYIQDIAAKLKKDPKTVARMKRLPLIRGAGKPFMTESALYHFVNPVGNRRYL